MQKENLNSVGKLQEKHSYDSQKVLIDGWFMVINQIPDGFSAPSGSPKYLLTREYESMRLYPEDRDAGMSGSCP
jgi:hypothetical protein